MAGPFSLGNFHFPTAVVPALSSKANSLFFFCSTAAIQLAKTTCRHWLLSSRRKRQHLWRIVINRLFLFHFGRLGGRACSCKKMKALRNWTYVSPADLIVPRATFHNSIFSRYIVKKKKRNWNTWLSLRPLPLKINLMAYVHPPVSTSLIQKYELGSGDCNNKRKGTRRLRRATEADGNVTDMV